MDPPSGLSAIVLAYNRADEVAVVLDRLSSLPVREVIVVDNGDDETEDVVRERGGPDTVYVRSPVNAGIAARNLGAQRARGELLLMLDDDCYPLPGAIEALTTAFAAHPRLAVAGGMVRDVDPDGAIVRHTEVGTFDWFLRGGRTNPIPADGVPAFFFPEGACMARRSTFLEAGGFYEPFFFTHVELELTTRLVGRGWEVRYLPAAEFDHRKSPAGRSGMDRVLRYRVRNQVWYFWRLFPAALAARRIAVYLLFDLVECAYRGALRSWAGGIADAWRHRDAVRPDRAPLPRAALRRAELNRGRMHLRFLAAMVARQLRRARAA